MWTVYLPCIFYYFWISLKSRSFGFFRAVNPAIVHGGMTLEDKNFVNQLLPQRYRPKSFLVKIETKTEEIENIIRENGLKYPVILKPNNGCRGRNVELIRNREHVKHILKIMEMRIYFWKNILITRMKQAYSISDSRMRIRVSSLALQKRKALQLRRWQTEFRRTYTIRSSVSFVLLKNFS